MHSEMYCDVGQSVHHKNNIPRYFKNHIEISQFLMVQRFEPILLLGEVGLGLFANEGNGFLNTVRAPL